MRKFKAAQERCEVALQFMDNGCRAIENEEEEGGGGGIELTLSSAVPPPRLSTDHRLKVEANLKSDGEIDNESSSSSRSKQHENENENENGPAPMNRFIVSTDHMTEYSTNLMLLLNEYFSESGTSENSEAMNGRACCFLGRKTRVRRAIFYFVTASVGDRCKPQAGQAITISVNMEDVSGETSFKDTVGEIVEVHFDGTYDVLIGSGEDTWTEQGVSKPLVKLSMAQSIGKKLQTFHFDNFIMVVIVISSLLLAIDNPLFR